MQFIWGSNILVGVGKWLLTEKSKAIYPPLQQHENNSGQVLRNVFVGSL